MSELAETCDAFLGGAVRLYQPRDGYRAGVDPVLLAAATQARSGQSVLELGCGAGTAILCLAQRVSDLTLVGVEFQPAYAELARRNAALNKVQLDVFEADLRDLPHALRAQSFDHVIANPPYYNRAKSTKSDDAGRDTALGGDTALSDWVSVAAKRLSPRGTLTLIQRIERLPEVLGAVTSKLGSVRVMPLQPRIGRSAQLVIVQAKKGGRADFVLEAPVLMHEGAQHMRDGESYTDRISGVLRHGNPLEWD